MSITSTMLILKGAEEQEWKELYNYIIELEKRNKEIYEGFMATTKELTEYAEEIERLNNIIKEAIEELENIPINANGGDILEIERKVYHILKGSEKE